MTLRGEYYVLVAAALYPLWLIAAGVDYLCHRRTDIEHTAGWRESVLHVAQYICMAPTVVLAALFTMTGGVLWFAAVAMSAHTVLAYVDVSYTVRRRYISALEQHVHGILTVVPPIAITLLALADAQNGTTATAYRGGAGMSTLELGLVFGATAVLGGAPIIEEFVRTMRARNEHPAS